MKIEINFVQKTETTPSHYSIESSGVVIKSFSYSDFLVDLISVVSSTYGKNISERIKATQKSIDESLNNILTK